MQMRGTYSDHVVEDGFSLENDGYNLKNFRQYFQGLPKSILQRMLKHFNNRREWEVCKILREMINSAPQADMAWCIYNLLT